MLGKSGRVDEHVVKRLVALFLIPIRLLLTLNTKRSPWYSGDALGADLFLAVQADSKRPVFNPTKGRPHVAQQIGLSVEVSDCQFAFRSVLHFIQCRDPELVNRPFFAKFDPDAKWLTDLQPAFADRFPFEGTSPIGGGTSAHDLVASGPAM